MKRYIKLISLIIVILTLIGTLFYFLLRQNGTSYITYIKLRVNPSFVIGINKDEKVVFYNALNSDANNYNLAMFQGKSLAEATSIFINKLGNSQENKDIIYLTVMTKNPDLEKHIVSMMENKIKEYDNNYQVILQKANKEELERFSNEVQYNLPKSLNNSDLQEISLNVYQSVNNYIRTLLNNIKMQDSDDRIEVLDNYKKDGYFNDFDYTDIELNKENVLIGDNTKYDVNFNLDGEGNIEYTINFSFEIQYTKKLDKTTIEVYEYSYELADDIDIISNLKTYFYVY